MSREKGDDDDDSSLSSDATRITAHNTTIKAHPAMVNRLHRELSHAQ
jgi:hypothetical protein